MSGNFLNPKQFFRDLFVNFVSGVAGGAVVGIFSGKLWLGVLSFLTILMVLFFLWLWNKYERMFKLIISGNAGYYFSFDLEENPIVWKEAKKSFCYLGISCDSIMEIFKRWMDEESLSKYYLLLMDPDSKALHRQEAFRIGHDLNMKLEDLSPQAMQAVNEAAEATKNRIRSAISLLKNSIPYKDGRMEIKLYKEFAPWWMYILDNRKVYIGILEKGKRGIKSPVFIIGKNDKYIGLFDAFKNNWKRIWESASDA